MAITRNNTPQVPPPMEVRNPLSASSPPMPRKTRPKVVAPSRMMKAMDVKAVVDSITSLRTLRFILPLSIVRTMAPAAPTAAASVGEATPKKIDPSTAMIRAPGGSRDLTTRAASCLALL